MDISNRVGSMQFSPIRRFNKYGFEAEANGKTVYRHLVPAYDSENGVLKYYYEKDGSEKMTSYEPDEWGKICWEAKKYAKLCADADNGEAIFDQ